MLSFKWVNSLYPDKTEKQCFLQYKDDWYLLSSEY